MQRLGINSGKYLGEGIDIARVLAQGEAAATKFGWTTEVFLQTDAFRMLAFKRLVAGATRRIYISTGIHGDEPAGPLAALKMLEQNLWPASTDLWLCPCLNPTGFPRNTRENAQGADLNRDYLNPNSSEVRAHIAWLDRQPYFDVSMCLHEDWESHGFYVYEVNPEGRPSFAEGIVERVSMVCPIDLSPSIEGRDAANGIIRPNFDPKSRPQWPEAFYLITHKSQMSYTMEAPSDFPIAVRVAALVNGVRSVLERA